MRAPLELEIAGYDGRSVPCVLYEVADAHGVGLLLPGAAASGGRLGGTPARPDLHFTSMLLRCLRLSVFEVWWDAGGAPRDDMQRWLRENAYAAARAAADAGEVRLLVGRSLGTGALATLLADPNWRGTPTIWIAPLVRHESVRAALRQASAPALVIGGSRDEAFDVAFARGLEAEGKEVVVLDGANHGLAVEDAIETVRLLARVLVQMRSFVERAVFEADRPRAA